MSSSAICQNFVQNAWKKELCSNCFKSKDEHIERPKPKAIRLISNENIEGIIRNTNKSRPKRNVCFMKELTEIIGFGGEDWENESDDEDLGGDSSESSEEDFILESEDEEADKELKRITKENTDFNTTNLKQETETGIVKKTTTQLMLGKPLIDSNGKKQTLMVSVTPFGEETKKLVKTITKNSKETITETKTNVILTSYTKNEEKSLLDEITETLENGKNPIQIMSRKKTQKEIVLTIPRNEANKENEESKPERKVGLSRTPALIKRDQEKPIIYQTTSTAKIELVNTKNKEIEEKVLGLPPLAPKLQNSLSREQAGEPDGRADPDIINEPPALPLTPPPILETQTSFLHQNSPIYDKPKIPSKPATVLIKKNSNNNNNNQIECKSPILTTFADLKQLEDENKPKILLTKQDSNGSDIAARAAANKRRAPKPPEEINTKIYTRNSTICLKKKDEEMPEPAPRKSLSLSTDSLITEEKRKKGRFSLKKFLRMGSSKEVQKICPPEPVKYEEIDSGSPPLPKPRLVIVHPSELNGCKVEVVAKQEPTYDIPISQNKPPTPPRNLDIEGKPHLPHPPKSMEILTKQRQYSSASPNAKKQETVYANIGEVRSAIVPNKPQRTASMREREALQHKQQTERKNYDNGENVYDYISNNSGRSSSPDSQDSNSNNKKIIRLNKRSESSIDVSGDYFNKYNTNIPRSLSLTYCGSETESEIYSPYSFYGSESEVTEDDHDWIQNGRTHKLRSRKGRSIVHKNLEDNYGAVIVANHEALAQVLENIQQTYHIQPALRGLKSLPNLRWNDFILKPTSQALTVGCRTFHQALWNTQNVTLLINTGTVPSSTLSLGISSLTPITEFSDLIPSNENSDKHIQVTVAVLPWLQITTIEAYSDTLKTKSQQNIEESWKDASFILLQLVNSLKILQSQGIEELSLTLNSFILCREMDKDIHYRLCILQGLGEELHLKDNINNNYGTLCMCASKALTLLPLNPKITPLLQSLLNNEKAVTLTQVKSILEFCLWGPSDVNLGNTIRERELALQRWLDLQRATVLHGLVCTRVQLTVYEECHLFFLVRSNARMMSDASLLLESANAKYK